MDGLFEAEDVWRSEAVPDVLNASGLNQIAVNYWVPIQRLSSRAKN
jgi:hypothetical protein